MLGEDQRRSAARLFHRRAHGGEDVVLVRPGPVHDPGDEAAFSGSDEPAVGPHFELAQPALFEVDGLSQAVPDEGRETRGLGGCRGSGVAVDDSHAHSAESSNSAAPRDAVHLRTARCYLAASAGAACAAAAPMLVAAAGLAGVIPSALRRAATSAVRT